MRPQKRSLPPGGAHSRSAVDVSDDDAVGAAVATTASTLGHVTGVVTAAGIFHGPDLPPIEQVGIDDFFHVLARQPRWHVLGDPPLRCRSSATAVARSSPIASTAAIRGHGFGPGYTASKGGVDTLARGSWPRSADLAACAPTASAPEASIRR